MGGYDYWEGNFDMTILKKIKGIIPLCVKEKVWDLRHLSQISPIKLA